MTVCPSCAESNPQRARFCLACGEPLPEFPGVVAESRRTVTILFADLAGSTVLGESLDVEALRYVTGRFFDAMRAAIEIHNGTVEKFIGDAVVAVFGAPRVREDDALRAVRATRDMHAALTRLNEELDAELGVQLSLRIGVNTGEVVTGERRAGGSVATGDAVNVAARLEQAAGPGEVLLGERTYRLVRDHIIATPIEPAIVKGKAQPVAAWRLLDLTPAPPKHSAGGAAFVGRATQMRVLQDAFARVEGEGTCQLVTVLGMAGIGKTRLAEEFIRRRDDALVLQGRCLSYGQGATYWPLREALLAAIGLSGDEPLATAERALAAVVADLPDAGNVVARLVALTGHNKDDAVPEDMPWAVRSFLEALARRRPVILVVDDLHWAEPGLLDVIEHIADWSRDAPIMLLVLARPEFLDDRPAWGGGKLNTASLLLPPLEVDAAASLVERHDLPAEVKKHIVAGAGGNPLFSEQLVAMLVDEGHARMSAGIATWTSATTSITLTVPPTVSALLSARIDRLDDEERATLGCAAVVGTTFYVDAVGALTARPHDHVRSLLDRLMRKELLRPATSDLPGMLAYRFLHALVRDAAYDGLAKATRAEWHEGLADWLLSLGADEVPDEIIGHHLAAAWDYRRQLGPATEHTRSLAARGARHLATAARRLDLSDISAAAALHRRAIELLEPEDPERVECQLRLGAQLLELGQIDTALDVLGDAEVATDPRQATLARVLTCRANSVTSDYRISQSQEIVADAVRRFGEWEDNRGLAHAYLVQADLEAFEGRVARATELVNAALRHAEISADMGCVARARSLLGVFYLFGPTPADEVIATLDRLLAQSGHDPRVRAEVEQVTCVMHAMRGRFDEARTVGAAARRHLAEVGHGLYLANLAQSTGRVEELAGDLEAAEREYERSERELLALGESAYLSTVAGLHARLLAQRNKPVAARAVLALAQQHGSLDDVTTQSLIGQVRALLASGVGEYAEESVLVSDAISLDARPEEAPDSAGEAHGVAADVAAMAGEIRREVEHLMVAYELFAAKGNVVRSRQVEARLAALRS